MKKTVETRDRSAEDLTPPTPEISSIEESLSENTILKLEQVMYPAVGIAGAVAHWGQRFETEVVGSIIVKKFGQDKKTDVTGFDVLYRVPEYYTPDEVIAEETKMVERLVGSVLELNQWGPKEVAALYFGGSPPKHPDYGILHPDFGYGAAIAKTTGLTHLNPKKDIANYYLACNAGGRALRDALTNPNLQGKNVLVVVVENLTGQIKGFDEKKADPLSLQFFSDGAAAIGVVPGVNLTYLLGESRAVEDKKGALAAVEPWRELIDPEGELIQVVGNTTLIQLPPPEEGKQISMKGWETTKLFLKNVPPVVEKVYKQYKGQYPEKEIKLAIAHHPSLGVNTLIKARLEKMGINIDMPWEVNDGNSSGATTLIAFVRLMRKFNPGDHIMVVSFGGGISIDVFVVEIGGGGEAIPTNFP